MATLYTDWLVPQRVLYLQHRDLLTLENLQAWVQQIHCRMNEAAHQDAVHIVYDASQRGEFDRFLFDRQALRRAITVHPQTGWVIVVTPDLNIFLRFLAQQVSRLFKLPVQFVPHLEAAHLFLQAADPTLQGCCAEARQYLIPASQEQATHN